MPSPFPGMDPYLEGSEWNSVHVALSAEMARQLAPKVRPKYIVRTARRFVTDMPEDIAVTAGDLYPDVNVAEAATPQGSGPPPALVLRHTSSRENLCTPVCLSLHPPTLWTPTHRPGPCTQQ